MTLKESKPMVWARLVPGIEEAARGPYLCPVRG